MKKTKLELANLFRRKSGTPDYFTTTVGQTGEAGDLVDWFDQAYELIQTHFSTWLFLRDTFTFNTVDSQQQYAALTIASDYARWDTNDWRRFLTASGVSTEQYITYIEWEDFRLQYLFGASRTSEGQPIYFTVAPDKSIYLYPLPDGIYTITGEYFAKPDIMELDTDTPVFDEQYQMVIVWKALELYGADSDEPNKENKGSVETRRFLARMSQQYLPQFNMGGPLA